MFFFSIIAATIAYALQSALMARYYRQMDPLSAVAYRGLGLAVTMTPLLFFVPSAAVEVLPAFLPGIFAACLAAALANWANAASVRVLPVGITNGMGVGVSTVLMIIGGHVLYNESFSTAQLLLVASIVAGVLLLGASKSSIFEKAARIPPGQLRIGLLAAVLYGLCIGIAFILVGALSRDLHPFLVAYLWEAFIGVCLAMMAWSRGWRGRVGLAPIGGRDFLKILLFSSPTLIGTGGYALAMTLGPIGIASAIQSTTIVFATLFAAWLYGERLNRWQWLLIFGLCGAVGGLKLISG